MPLSAEECDEFCLPHLSMYLVNLTDGASPYEAFAGGKIRCSPDCDRKDCLKRAQAVGKTECTGMRPRDGRERYQTLYKDFKMAHGVVTHKKEEWSLVKEVRVWGPAGSKTILLKHGTEVVDGTWSELKAAVPSTLQSSLHDRIADYVHAWAWMARRHGQDLFLELGKAMSEAR